jgi:hypothetical protein
MRMDAGELQLPRRKFREFNRRNRLESTRTGSRKLNFHQIQRVPSLASRRLAQSYGCADDGSSPSLIPINAPLRFKPSVARPQDINGGHGPSLPTWALQQVGSWYEPGQAVIVLRASPKRQRATPLRCHRAHLAVMHYAALDSSDLGFEIDSPILVIHVDSRITGHRRS